jgi:YaiO family outer membrane protein
MRIPVGRWAALAFALCSLLLSASARAQIPQTPLEQARTLARDGRTAEALGLLSPYLAAAPQDSDARTLRATILSWVGRFDEARTDLDLVLSTNPNHPDALAVLARIELWTGHADRAEALASKGLVAAPASVDLMEVRALALEQLRRYVDARAQIERLLAITPDSPTGLRIRRRVMDRQPSWIAGAQYRFDRFDDDRASWHEMQGALSRHGGAGSIGVRVYDARRFGVKDQLFELEAYPLLSKRTYAFVAAAWSPDASLYPKRRYVADLYQVVGDSWELSAGIRLLDLGEAEDHVDVYSAGLQRYDGSWLYGARLWFAPDQSSDSLTVDGLLRRYRRDGVSYFGARASRGRYRDDERTTAGLADLVSASASVELAQRYGRLEWTASGGLRRQDLAGGTGHLWQTTAAIGLRVRF